MTTNKFIAHQRNLDQKEQTVQEHLEEVSMICRNLSGKIKIPEIGDLLGLLHDFGKYSQQFQSYIKSATGILNPDIDDDFVDFSKLKGRIDHSSAGAQWVWENFRNFGPQGQLVGKILALCLASHHGGLIDCLTPEGRNGFQSRIGKYDEKTHLTECVKVADKKILERLNSFDIKKSVQNCSRQLFELVDPKRKQSDIICCFNIGMWTRFLFSCLIDADRINSADFENPGNRNFRQKNGVNWQLAINRFENKLKNFTVKYDIDLIRKQISSQCKARASDSQGIYTLTVPTGGGKTLASMRYALHHAQEHTLDRIIYIIPYTSIIEQNAKTVRDMLDSPDDEFSWVLEHHSNFEPEQQTWNYKIISENWDAPIIFTTMVQFLETLFGGGTRGARRMHQLANSVLIFDEIQTLPIKCVHLFCNAMNFLTFHAKTTVLLCTATQPLLNNLKSPDKGELKIPKGNELVENVTELFDKLKRVEIIDEIRPEGWSESELTNLAISEFEQKGSCLVIVNTKKWAQLLYELCSKEIDSESIFHLSTSLCPAHRKKLLAEIRERLDAEPKLPVLCISTQLIEAGVDVDFASVVRFLAGLDSIAQAAGRCNRNGRWSQATVHVVNPQNESIDRLLDIKEGRDKALRVLSEKRGSNLLDPDVMKLYFSYYFYKRADEMDYPVSANQAARDDSLLSLLSNNKLNILRTNPLQLRQSFKTAGKIFQAIDAPTQAVLVPYGNGRDIIAQLCADPEPAKAYKLLKQAQQYSVNVFPNVWQKLQKEQAVFPVQKGESVYYIDERYYSDFFGLSTEEVSQMETQIV